MSETRVERLLAGKDKVPKYLIASDHPENVVMQVGAFVDARLQDIRDEIIEAIKLKTLAQDAQQAVIARLGERLDTIGERLDKLENDTCYNCRGRHAHD